MKNRIGIVAAALVGTFVLIATVAVVWKFSGKMPFRDMRGEDIEDASVYVAPPDETFSIDDTETLAELLGNIVVYQEDNSYSEYAGQASVFKLRMADGADKEITIYLPFVIIDGKGYRAKYEPCHELDRYVAGIMEGRK